MSVTDQQGVEGTPGVALQLPVAQAYEKSRAAEFGLGRDQFTTLLEEAAAKNFPGTSKLDEQELCSRLRVDDLVLARSCAAGNERAWEAFMARFREKLYEVARQITREDSSGRELADSVYTDLFGMKTREGERISKLSSYSGRGSLEGWLRTVLAQEYVNSYRKQRKLVSLDEESEEGAQFAAIIPESPILTDSRLESAVAETLRTLSPEDRFVLASYFLDQCTLAQIAKALSVHESTISRKVEKLTKVIRKQILKNLAGQGMSRRQAEEVLSADVRDIVLDVRASLAQDSVAKAFSEKGVKASEGG